MRINGGFVKYAAYALIGLFAVAILFPMFARAKNGKRPPCISKLKQIATAAFIYQSDHGERMPLLNWMDTIRPYVKSEVLYTCEVVAQRGKKYGYAMNYKVVGLYLPQVEESSETIAFFETDALGRSVVANLAAQTFTRHDGVSFVTRLDTSSKGVREPEPPSP